MLFPNARHLLFPVSGIYSWPLAPSTGEHLKFMAWRKIEVEPVYKLDAESRELRDLARKPRAGVTVKWGPPKIGTPVPIIPVI